MLSFRSVLIAVCFSFVGSSFVVAEEEKEPGRDEILAHPEVHALAAIDA